MSTPLLDAMKRALLDPERPVPVSIVMRQETLFGILKEDERGIHLDCRGGMGPQRFDGFVVVVHPISDLAHIYYPYGWHKTVPMPPTAQTAQGTGGDLEVVA